MGAAGAQPNIKNVNTMIHEPNFYTDIDLDEHVADIDASDSTHAPSAFDDDGISEWDGPSSIFMLDFISDPNSDNDDFALGNDSLSQDQRSDSELNNDATENANDNNSESNATNSDDIPTNDIESSSDNANDKISDPGPGWDDLNPEQCVPDSDYFHPYPDVELNDSFVDSVKGTGDTSDSTHESPHFK